MSWVPITNWALRCDGRTTRGQCDALLFHEDEVSPLAWNDAGQRVCQPKLFTARVPLERLRAEPTPGWLITRERVLCPEHVQAQEHMVATAVDGLPFDED